jgi:hypothetical protein
MVANHQSLPNGANTTVLNQDVCLIIINGSHNPPVLDKHCSHLPLPVWLKNRAE